MGVSPSELQTISFDSCFDADKTWKMQTACYGGFTWEINVVFKKHLGCSKQTDDDDAVISEK